MQMPPLRPPEISDRPRDISQSDWTQEVSMNEWAQNIVEWHGLVSLSSARIRDFDRIEPLHSRWDFPEDTYHRPMPVIKLRWKGLVDPTWVRLLLMSCM